jgi:hypothetical protein
MVLIKNGRQSCGGRFILKGQTVETAHEFTSVSPRSARAYLLETLQYNEPLASTREQARSADDWSDLAQILGSLVNGVQGSVAVLRSGEDGWAA